MRIRRWAKWGVLLTIASLAVIISQCTQSNSFDQSTDTHSSEELTYLNHSDTVGYVGIETCKKCHVQIYESFVQTGMGSSFGPADTANSIADISGHKVLHDTYRNLSYHPHWMNDSLQLTEFRLNGNDTTYKKEITVDYVVGSGQHTNSHLFQQNGYLFQLPFTWYAQKEKLDLPPGFEDGNNTRFGRMIGLECTSCHNAIPLGFEKGSINKYSKVPGAIDCERCHGPGELHVSRMLKGEFVDTATEVDYSIVNINKLPIDMQFEACQRCHLQGNSVVAEDKSFFDFKPGMKLNSVMDIYLPRYSNSEDDFIMASHVDRFKQSPCYINSNEFNCVSCHNPHISVRFTDNSQFNKGCQNCHKGSAPRHECTEETSKLEKVNYNCVSCHMPKSSSTDIPHVTVHDHKIAVHHETKDTSGIKRFLGLVAINNDNPTDRSKALAYLQQYERFGAQPYYLDSADYFLKKIDAPAQHQNFWVQYLFLRKDWQRLIAFVEQEGGSVFLRGLTNTSYDNEDAWTAYRIGEAYARQNSEEALPFYKKATELAPFIPDFQNKYASVLLKHGYQQEGIVVLKKLLEEQPFHKEALNNLGYTYLAEGKFQLSALYLEKALAEDPDYEQAWLNMATLYLQTEELEKAKTAVKEVLRVNPMNKKAKQALSLLK